MFVREAVRGLALLKWKRPGVLGGAKTIRPE
jgi:hypothetical protein